MLIAGWFDPLKTLQQELIQLEEEGYVVPDMIKKECKMLHPVADAWSERIERIYQKLDDLPLRTDWPYEEPDELEVIRRLRPAGVRQLKMSLSDEKLLSCFHGAWRGRGVGCTLGKPVENRSRAWIKELLVRQNEWELDNYFRSGAPGLICPNSQRENLHGCMETDDDLRYPVLALRVLEQHGSNFTWSDIAGCWNISISMSHVATAELQGLLNYNLRHTVSPDQVAATAVFTRKFCNPYREWIGAAIRADCWGYVAAGNPELAAEFAYRDACWTHAKNGIYSEMFLAAMIAAAFVETDVLKLIEIGLSEIPSNCRIAEAVRRSLLWYEQCRTWEDFMDHFDEHYKNMHPVHAINNLQIVLMALLYGNGTIDRNTALAVMAGLDTDCNGATVGSITGILNPESNLAKCLNDTLNSDIIGEGTKTMSELAGRTLAVYKKIRKNNK